MVSFGRYCMPEEAWHPLGRQVNRTLRRPRSDEAIASPTQTTVADALLEPEPSG